MTSPIDRVDLSSLNITDLQKQKLKALFPEVFTEGNKIDFDRLKQTLGETVDSGKERFGMNWAGKSDCFKTIQQPSIATLVPARDESVDFDTTENLFIEGDNLEVLKLLQKSYLGKVKMIYIDPPYNTGNDFIYPDNYSENLDTYLEYTGQIDGEGRKFSTNVETDGRFHSKWMNMMYPRLFLAKNLLREDGVIFISIDDNEVNNLRAICNEVFGEENFLAEVTVQNNPRGRQSDRFFATVHEYVMIYAKNSDECQINGARLTNEQRAEFNLSDDSGKSYRLLGLRQRGAASLREDRPDMYFPIYVNPDTLHVSLELKDGFTEKVLPRKSTGEDGRWMWGKEKCIRDVGLLVPRLITRRNEWDIFVIDFLERNGAERARKLKTIWDEKGYNTQNGTQEVKDILGASVASFPKPVEFIQNIVQILTVDDIILDFFAGSGTTGQAVVNQNINDKHHRRYILVQLPEPLDPNIKDQKLAVAYCDKIKKPHTIAEITKERLRRVATKIKSEQTEAQAKPDLFNQNQTPSTLDLGFRVFKLQKSNFKVWDANTPKDPEAIQQALELHIDHIDPHAKQEAILFELLLKSGFELTTPIKTLCLADKTVYSIADEALLICLDKSLTPEVIKAMAELNPSRVICLDEGFQDNDQLKTNAVLIMKSHGVNDFRTV